MTAAEYRRLRRMLQRERQKGLLALDLLTDVATQNDWVFGEPDVSGIDQSTAAGLTGDVTMTSARNPTGPECCLPAAGALF